MNHLDPYRLQHLFEEERRHYIQNMVHKPLLEKAQMFLQNCPSSLKAQLYSLYMNVSLQVKCIRRVDIGCIYKF